MMEDQQFLSNPLAGLLINSASRLSLSALARKLELSYHGHLIAIQHGASNQSPTLKVVEGKPYMCVFCGSCFTQASALRQHAHTRHGYSDTSTDESFGFETDVDLGNFVSQEGLISEDERRKDLMNVFPLGAIDLQKNSTNPNVKDGSFGEDSERLMSSFSDVGNESMKNEIMSDGEIEAEEVQDDFTKCVQCEKTFIDEEKLRAHEMKHCGKEFHKCSACRVAYIPSRRKDEGKKSLTTDMSSLSPAGTNSSNGSVTGQEGSSAGNLPDLPSKTSLEITACQGIDCVLCGETFGILQHMLEHVNAYTSFPCTFCDSEFSTMRDLGWHCKQKHDLLVVRCPFCSRGFREYSHLAYHMREHKGYLCCGVCKDQCLSKTSFEAHMEFHQCCGDLNGGSEDNTEFESQDSDEDRRMKKEKQVHVCHVCSQVFNSFYSIFHHMRRQHPAEHLSQDNKDLVKRKFICKKCGFSFRRKDTLERHEAIHNRGDYPRRKGPHGPHRRPLVMQRSADILCKVCGKSFLRASNLEAHMEEAHPQDTKEVPEPVTPNKKKFCCNICGKYLMSQKSLDRHLIVHQEPKYSCPICDKKLKHQETLKSHMRTHTGEKPFVCDVCNQSFSQRTAYVQHMCIHTGERPHECNICQKTFVRQAELQMHEAKHSNMRLFSCDHCSKTFKTEKQKRVHEKQIHSDSIQSYQCDKCGKSFPWASGLKAHVCSHDGEAPYKCPECDQAFAQEVFLKRHMQSHTKSFSCEQCNQGFKNQNDLQSHMMEMHGAGQPVGTQGAGQPLTSNAQPANNAVPVSSALPASNPAPSDQPWKPAQVSNAVPVSSGLPVNSPVPSDHPWKGPQVKIEMGMNPAHQRHMSPFDNSMFPPGQVHGMPHPNRPPTMPGHGQPPHMHPGQVPMPNHAQDNRQAPNQMPNQMQNQIRNQIPLPMNGPPQGHHPQIHRPQGHHPQHHPQFHPNQGMHNRSMFMDQQPQFPHQNVMGGGMLPPHMANM